MVATVVPIRAGLEPEPPAGSVNAVLVKDLQELVAKASAGEITGVAYVTLHPGDLTCYHRVGRITRGVVGALSILQFDMVKDCNEVDNE
ncbi:hypothetical protein IC762_12295 [Bradyrhizobium genosp. L]|uniref:hypothetical protein n=1 Tax=Bradyrhizobium genosp. L TaxID=83637 RepID=UPI0018A28E7F|nr:hypothetical protein [Bradyrhizobium genosp. L]QPF87025.1 hypothetical protein IC762_12295 [Bradyrhizobium genosp. L]